MGIMKADFALLLDQASWPAFLVDDTAMIRRANTAAIQVFGTVLEADSALSASLWASENEGTAEEFVQRLERSSSPMVSLRFKVKGGAVQGFDTFVCTFSREGAKYHVFQLFGSGARAGRSDAGAANAGGGTVAAEAGAAQKQKLECALQLSRTVALDFNNALTTILGHASLILGKMEPAHPWRRSLMEIEKSAERAAEVAQDLADFSRQERDARAHQPGNLNRVVQNAVEAFQHPSGADIHWTLHLEKRLYTVTFDEAKLLQALGRILENALEAVGRNGRITVRTQNHSLTEPVLSPVVQLPPGHYVSAEVTDNGCGIPPEIQTRVFEPFFTTKGGPQHRGLGLAWVYGIVTNHGGVVSIVSAPGQGTTVRIFLPAQQKIVRDTLTQIEDLRGTQKVLIVDDEEMVLNLGQTVLGSFGYTVAAASSGARALELFTQTAGQFDLVVTDLVMPGMSGRELVDQIRKLSPKIPILCMSGYVRAAADEQGEGYLRKPFTSQELLRRVKQMLLRGAGSGSSS